ncbi:hypothetical protein SHVI106290_03230 [Shewanella violacea]
MASSPFLDAIRQDIRLRGYSIRTEKSYLYWIKRYILFIIKNIRQSLVQGMLNYFSVGSLLMDMLP